MGSTDFLGKGWAFPVMTRGGKVMTAADDTDIAQSIYIILQTALGERVMRPRFGSRLSELLFAPNNGTTLALAELYTRQALDTWEPRIDVTKVTATNTSGNRIDIFVLYTIREKNAPDNLVFPFFLQS